MAETYFAGDLSDFLPTKPFSTDGFNAATRSDLGDTFWLGADLAQNSRALEQSMANLAVDPVLSNQAETSRSIASNTTDHLIVQMSELLSGDRLLTDQVSQPASDSLAGAWQLAQAQLSQFLENPEFEAVMATAFGEQADANQARQIIADWGQGQDLPALETMPTAVLQARGAFSASSQTVYLGQDWLEQNSQSAIAAVLLEELGHALDSRLNVTDAAGDEGAIFAALVQGQAIAPAALASLKAENDHALLHWQGSDWAVEQAALGEFTVGATGQVSVEFVFDGGAYTGELALFSLTGLESLMPGSDAYTAEAARRALSGSSEGYVVISDAKQRATVSGELGERDWNQGRSSSPVPVALTPGDRFGFMLAPNGSVQDVFNQPAGDSKQRPLFSMAAANPQGLIQMGQMTNGLFAMEDLRRDRRSDDDFNDLIFKVEGATGQAAALESLLPRRYDWQNTDTFERILAIASPVPPAGPSPNPGGSPDPNPT
ncbi:MAG: DUF4114 domain-containing protein, partial [Leptolyngbyaceae cyanobacterium SL_1_1]|nr:DUF4114 domain-containing protein [Leptolyngbyaceae cyanobacterium SL_1_1]